MKIILLPLLLLSSLTAFADDATWLADARKVATTVPPKLLQVLTEEIAKGGPESAIVTVFWAWPASAVCEDMAISRGSGLRGPGRKRSTQTLIAPHPRRKGQG